MRRAIRIRTAGPIGFLVWGFMLAAVVAVLWPAVGRASIPDTDIRAGYNEAGFGVGNGNFIYDPSWGLEVGYRFTPAVDGTVGVTGRGLVGLGLRF